MHQMRTIAIDVSGICKSVCLSVMRLCFAKTVERIEVLFGVQTPGAQGTRRGKGIRCGLRQITLATVRFATESAFNCYGIPVYDYIILRLQVENIIAVIDFKVVLVYVVTIRNEHDMHQHSSFG